MTTPNPHLAETTFNLEHKKVYKWKQSVVLLARPLRFLEPLLVGPLLEVHTLDT